MQSENNVPDYQKIISRARNSRLVNIILSSVGIVVCIAAVILAINTEYIYFAASCAVIPIILFAAIILKSAGDMKSVKSISNDAVFAALLEPEQHIRIKQYIMRRAQLFYFTVFIVVILPEAATFTAMYYLLENSVYLLYLGAVAIFCLICTLLAILYLSARLTVADMMILVSGNGIMAGDEVISFNAKKKETLQLLRFKDYYYLNFIKTSILAIKNISEIIFPVDGSLRKGLTGLPDEELALALELDNVFVTEDEFYESKNYLDSGVVDEEEKLPAPKKQKTSEKKDIGGKQVVDAILESLGKETGSSAQHTVELEAVSAQIPEPKQQPASGDKKKTYKEPPADTPAAANPKKESPKKNQINNLIDSVED